MTKFSDLKLDPKVLQAIAEAGYETPTPIQAGAIPPALEGRDVLGIAQTGTGKTASFTLPMITLLGRGRARARMPRSLVLAPTRELAAQVAENFDTYAKHTKLTKALLIGGVSFGEQDKLIDRGVDVLIATPGRLLDHFERGKLLLTGVQIMVVDEADRMLDMGFIPDIERIFQLTPFTRQTLFFSATMAPEIERITDTFLHAPERIEVARQATTSETITQRLVELTPTRKDQTAKQKRELLRALIDAEGEGLKNAIIFCNRKTDVDIVAKSLKAHGYDAAPIHGDLDQRVRMATLDGFREGTLRFLVASDVAARGLDIPAVSHVFNFDLPSHAEDYVHRIGRTGRAGREGTAISIGTPADEKYLSAIENLVKQSLPRASAPEGFRLSDAAQKPPRPASERGNSRGAPTRTRSRRSSPREESVKEPVEAAEVVIEEKRTPERAPEPRGPNGNGARNGRAEERQERPAERRDERRDNGREDRRDDRRERYRDRDRGPGVVGMGDHTPDFLLTSFSDALAVTEARMAANANKPAAPEAVAEEPKAEELVAEAVAVVEVPEAAEAEAPQKRSRSRRSRSPRAVAEAETTADEAVKPEQDAAAPSGDAAVEEAATEAAAEPASEPQAEKPAKKRAPRTRRKSPAKAAAEESAAESVPSEAAAPQEAAAGHAAANGAGEDKVAEDTASPAGESGSNAVDAGVSAPDVPTASDAGAEGKGPAVQAEAEVHASGDTSAAEGSTEQRPHEAAEGAALPVAETEAPASRDAEPAEGA
ncbi:Superfamily II DNA and RNA helicase [Paracoccus chinensis]|uniref:DEAD-box ATP-dependent RNA helicase RhpA n=1 Tax=Paracoccus chinensis TaxID=525640 RepID=A0A1G9F437_9RHOB|nr:Superfamily II DNA and RNA helicase [Paracoccus chinensis]